MLGKTPARAVLDSSIVVFAMTILLLSSDAAVAHAVTDRLEIVCSAADVHFDSVRSGVDLALEKAGKAWVVSAQGPGFLSMPGCKFEPLAHERGQYVPFVTAAGDILFEGPNYGKDGPDIFLRKAGTDAPLKIEPPPGLDRGARQPVLSDDGSALVWVETRVLDRFDHLEHRLWVRDLATGRDRTIVLQDEPWRSQLSMLGANISEGEYVLRRFPNKVLIVDGAGKRKIEPIHPSEIEHFEGPGSFWRVTGGWVARDIHRDQGHKRIQWSTPRGSGVREMPLLGFAMAVDPSGRLIAVTASAAPAYEIADAVFIIRVEDGREVFHRDLPERRLLKPYDRARWMSLAFLGPDYLAMDSKDGINVFRISGLVDTPVDAKNPEPSPTIDQPAMVTRMGEALAKTVGLTFERPTADTKTAILGRWKIYCEHSSTPDCGEGNFFAEFGEDGYTYDEDRRPIGRYTITDNFIQMEDGPAIFQMSGGFYLPSRESVLTKLTKVK
jgi:hypothetical protein